ncbi:MAG: DMT family transporter [Paracoccaceae bacterium]|jgi:drug/metabolite transporter (DMT)-like permease|nr:DMT family transporter [Paracoccaceae bacterium]MDG1939883.1 DMT family transporter [Paracoccaceae bacterium]|tara:strand:+ start:59 stop:955 length:897 start_codon:yes stop_codon:yes gene_type:complete
MHISGNELRGHLAMLAFSGLVAGSFALGVKVANDITPAAFTLIRFVIAVSILATVLLIKTEFTKKVFKAPWRFFVLGGCIAIYFVLMFEGLKIASSVSLAAVFTFAPLLSGLFGYILVRQKMSLSIFTALIIGAIGALWVVFEGNFQRLIMLEFGLGEMIFFCGVVFHALYTPLSRKLNRGESPLGFAFATTLGATVLMIFYGIGDVYQTDLLNLSWMVWLTLFYTALFASALTFFLIQYATLVLPSSKVMAYTYLVPSWALMWELGLGQNISIYNIGLGILLTIFALVILLWAPEGV